MREVSLTPLLVRIQSEERERGRTLVVVEVALARDTLGLEDAGEDAGGDVGGGAAGNGGLAAVLLASTSGSVGVAVVLALSA